MMRTQQPAGCSGRMGWFLAAFAAFVIVFQASWLHSLRACGAASRGSAHALAHAEQPASHLVANASALPLCAPPGEAALLAANASRDALPVLAAAAPAPAAACARPKPRLMIVTAEQPTECSTATAQWLGARAMRNRMQYAQAHGYTLYWNTDSVDPDYAGTKESGMWNKARLGCAAQVWVQSADAPRAQPALLSKLLNSNLTDGIDWLLWIGASCRAACPMRLTPARTC